MSKAASVSTVKTMKMAVEVADVERLYVGTDGDGVECAYLKTECKKLETALKRLVRNLVSVEDVEFNFSEQDILGEGTTFKEMYDVYVEEIATGVHVVKIEKKKAKSPNKADVNVALDKIGGQGCRVICGEVKIGKEYKQLAIPNLCRSVGFPERIFSGADGLPIFGKDNININTKSIVYGYEVGWDDVLCAWRVTVKTNIFEFVKNYADCSDLAAFLAENSNENSLQCLKLARNAFREYAGGETKKIIVNVSTTLKGSVYSVKRYRKNLDVCTDDFLITPCTSVKTIQEYKKTLAEVKKFGEQRGVVCTKNTVPGTENYQIVYEKVG